MNTTQRLLERVRRTTETGSDYAVAKALNISVQRMSAYMKGRSDLQEHATIARAAELIGDDPAAVLAEFQAESAKNDKAAFYWRRLATMARQHAAAALAACAMLSPALFSGNADAASGTVHSDRSATVYYVNYHQHFMLDDAAHNPLQCWRLALH